MKYESIEQELDKKFKEKHLQSGKIIESFKRLGEYHRAASLLDCGTFLTFKAPIGAADVPAKLYQANFCKDRLCPMCSWRRTKKIFGQVSKVMNEIEKNYRFIFVTLTVQNCSAEELNATVSNILRAFKKLHDQKRVRAAFKGFFRSLEITYHVNYPRSLQYHPHLHIIYAVNQSYFKKSSYIPQYELVKLWQECACLDYAPVVDMRVVSDTDKKGEHIGLRKAVSEVSKYTLKDAEICQGNEDQIDRAVYFLSTSIKSRRLCAFGGIFKEVAKQLDLDDLTDGDLVLTDNEEELRKDITYMLVTYHWQIGLGYQFHSAEPMEEDHDPE